MQEGRKCIFFCSEGASYPSGSSSSIGFDIIGVETLYPAFVLEGSMIKLEMSGCLLMFMQTFQVQEKMLGSPV